MAVLTTEEGAMLRSDLRTLELSGRDAGVFVSDVVPLLDGTRARDELAAALEGYSEASVFALLDALSDYGMLEEAREPGDPASELQQEFLARVAGDPSDAWRRVREGRVAMVGLEPWGVSAAVQLARSGLAGITLLDDRPPSEHDLGLRSMAVGGSRSEVLARQIEWMLPDCDARPRPLGDLATVIGGDFDLVIVATSIDDIRVLTDVARAADELGVPSLYAHVEGLDAVLGPFVVPGQTACWNCYRLRRLANADDPSAAHKVQRGIEAAPAASRAHPHLVPMPDLLGNLLALESLKIVSRYEPSQLGGRVLVQNLVTLVSSMHGVVRLPWCEVCGGASARRPGARHRSGPRHLPTDDEEDGQHPLAAIEDPDELRARLDGWVDERTGVIRLLTLGHPEPPDPELPFTSTAIVAAYTDGVHHEPWSELASGKGLTRTAALLGAAGEAIERYSASRYRRSDLFRARLQDVPGDRIDPRELCLYDDSQYAREGFPFPPYREDEPLDWVSATWLDNGEPVMVPAFLAYFNFHCPPEERFAQVNSNGLAAGEDEEDAAIRATFELIERDSFVLTWLARVPGRRLIPDGLDAEVREAVRQLEVAGARIELALLGAGARIPAVACLAFGDGREWPGMTVALAAHADPFTAVRKAILEQGHVGPFVRRLMDDASRAPIDDPRDVRTLEDHALYYVPPERQARAEFMLAGGEVKLSELPAPGADLRACCVRALEDEGVRVAIVDVTSPDVAHSPFRVARALGVHMQPIHFGHGLERLANPRLRRIAPDGINPDPHPLA